MQFDSFPELVKLRRTGEANLFPQQIKITVGAATCGLAAGAEEVYQALDKRIQQRGLDVHLSRTGCLGCCQREPLVDVRLPGFGRVIFAQMTQARARALVDKLAQGELLTDWAWTVVDQEELVIPGEMRKFSRQPALNNLPEIQQTEFFAPQRKIVLRNCGMVNPESLGEYLARDGYQGLFQALSHFSPQGVIDEVKKSGLRGRGGGGFSTGRKWQVAKDTPAEVKYLICNADEGDPGAYMDRTVLESDPHSVIEGMLIGAYAVGASQGYIYIRDEYPLAIDRLGTAIEQASSQGLLGKAILGMGFSFDLEIIRGAGAFVCGEETAMIASIEGGSGEPRPKPPYPAVAGLWGQPTVINNVKTWATVPVILKRGAHWYNSLGAPDNAGTVVFSLVGQIANTGLVEVPFGMTLGELLQEVGGGGSNGRAIKAVQTGGPSGGCLPARLFDTPITYEAMSATGSIMGSGGMVALDESACMVDVARYFLEFTQLESCGKCTACREGTRHLREILERITHGAGLPGDLDLLEEVGMAVQQGSLCGLGQTAPNPVLSTLRYFREEYEEHVIEKRCPTDVCRMTAEATHV
ncbi:MAG: NADH-ubiquinone oxidoreductase-F iron-sulfur binding region domain-containing protein [Anaerolineales bacterium]